MRAPTWHRCIVSLALSLGIACVPAEDDPGTTGSGGRAAGTGGASASGGASGSGGSGSGGALGTGDTVGSGGTVGTGGATGSGGAPGSGGANAGGGGRGGGGNSGSIGGSGMSQGGRGGNSGTGAGGAAGTGGGGKAAVMPSGGCGKANPQTGSSSSPLTISGHQYYVKLPTAYDPNKPYPVLFVFNPTNNPISWAEQSAGFEKNGAKDAAIRVYPHPANSSAGWGAGDVSFFKPLYDQVTSSFCMDKARMFATGESSGGDFSSILGCEHADKLRAVGPCATKNVSQYPLDATRRMCTGQVTAVVIHGKNDSVVGPENGPKTKDFYRALNHCGTETQPVSGYTDTMSNCVQYQGCDPGYPVYWCQHTDPEYSGTNHGWPKFAANMLWGVFSAY